MSVRLITSIGILADSAKPLRASGASLAERGAAPGRGIGAPARRNSAPARRIGAPAPDGGVDGRGNSAPASLIGVPEERNSAPGRNGGGVLVLKTSLLAWKPPPRGQKALRFIGRQAVLAGRSSQAAVGSCGIPPQNPPTPKSDIPDGFCGGWASGPSMVWGFQPSD